MPVRPTLLSLLAALALALVPTSQAGPLPEPIAAALRASGIGERFVGIWVQPLDAPGPELSLNADQAFNPASVMKLVTTLAALDTLGPAYVWKTRVAMTGTLREGVLEGDLFLQGGGDPALTLERFWSLLRELRGLGVRQIRGDVILDNGFYAIAPSDPGRFDGAPLRPYNAPPAALLVNHNTLTLRLVAEGEGVRAELDPPPAVPVSLGFEPELGACGGVRERLRASQDGEALRLIGRYPIACGRSTVWLNLLAPEQTVASAFQALWAELGGALAGSLRVGTTPPEARPLLEFDSPPLALLVRDVNTYSSNVMAKMLYLNLGAARFGPPATWDKAERALRAWLAEKGWWFPELVLENGSGLSRSERIAPASLARLLRWAADSPAYYPFAASLPVLGVNGTTRSRLAGTPLAGQAWLKTGSLEGVRALAGYVLGRDGRRRVLVLLVNHRLAAGSGPLQEALIEWAVNAAGAPEGLTPTHQNGN